ncbi:hypothetical protein I2I11_02455 [Pontibacter sp. 172403-2]|uniref:hypothetical protein n=1 Tax=Pontibacter rufus TaxID=2791028 RepID=UPI0018AF8F88|nr:hypothetical protein [Pontibacter sp. 172403-2]MBF9252145.1 hypothetical protein [Pontibacter sp. 172403-2]
MLEIKLIPFITTSVIAILRNDEMLLADSCSIITCSARRKPKVAPALTAKGYCSAKKLSITLAVSCTWSAGTDLSRYPCPST